MNRMILSGALVNSVAFISGSSPMWTLVGLGLIFAGIMGEVFAAVMEK